MSGCLYCWGSWLCVRAEAGRRCGCRGVGCQGWRAWGVGWEITNPASPWGRGTFPAPFLPKGLGLRFVPDF